MIFHFLIINHVGPYEETNSLLTEWFGCLDRPDFVYVKRIFFYSLVILIQSLSCLNKCIPLNVPLSAEFMHHYCTTHALQEHPSSLSVYVGNIASERTELFALCEAAGFASELGAARGVALLGC